MSLVSAAAAVRRSSALSESLSRTPSENLLNPVTIAIISASRAKAVPTPIPVRTAASSTIWGSMALSWGSDMAGTTMILHQPAFRRPP